jgi:branched-subunit amino acid aminotransferase/4-amino-4-deoxychorismate lyase
MRPSPSDEHAGHKTLNYWQRLRELRAAAARGADEALVFDASASLCGGCVSNVFVVKAGIVRTPWARGDTLGPDPDAQALAAATGHSTPTSATPIAERPDRAPIAPPVLPGITRRWALDCCQQWGVPIVRDRLTIDDCLDADEILLTNSGWGVLPVSRVEATPIGRGTPGAVSARLVEAWTRLLAGANG